MNYEIEIQQIRKAFIEVDASSEKEAEEKARENFHQMLIDGSVDEEINIIGIDWEED